MIELCYGTLVSTVFWEETSSDVKAKFIFLKKILHMFSGTVVVCVGSLAKLSCIYKAIDYIRRQILLILLWNLWHATVCMWSLSQNLAVPSCSGIQGFHIPTIQSWICATVARLFICCASTQAVWHTRLQQSLLHTHSIFNYLVKHEKCCLICNSQ